MLARACARQLRKSQSALCLLCTVFCCARSLSPRCACVSWSTRTVGGSQISARPSRAAGLSTRARDSQKPINNDSRNELNRARARTSTCQTLAAHSKAARDGNAARKRETTKRSHLARAATSSIDHTAQKTTTERARTRLSRRPIRYLIDITRARVWGAARHAIAQLVARDASLRACVAHHSLACETTTCSRFGAFA